MTTITIHRSSHLRPSPNRRFLVTENGEPFFWLGDDARLLFQACTREEAERYLRARAAQRFNVIHAAVGGSGGANPYGHQAYAGGDRAQPVAGWFEHLDWCLQRAAALGMYVGLMPDLPPGTTVAQAAAQAAFLGRACRERSVVWVLGPGEPAAAAAREAFAKAIKEHAGGRHLVTGGGDEPWADLFCRPSAASAPWDAVRADWLRVPARPVLDGGSADEDGDALDDVRRAAYWQVLAGACGHTYRHGLVAGFASGGTLTWNDALHHPGAEQMHLLRQLMEARPYSSRVPDQSLLLGDTGVGAAHCQASRGSDGLDGASGSYALVYSGAGRPFTVDMTRLTGVSVVAAWFDPRSGRTQWVGQYPVRGERTFTPPSEDDWVLVLDDGARNYHPVGHGGDRGRTSL
jgi:hypothetical protein